MEAGDVFATGVEIAPAEDPFEGSDFGNWDASVPGAAPDVPIETAGLPEVPVVNAEGEQIGSAPAQPVAQEPPVAAPAPSGPSDPAAEAAAYRESHGEPEPAPVAAVVEAQPEPTPPAESAGPTDEDLAAAALGSDEVLPAAAVDDAPTEAEMVAARAAAPVLEEPDVVPSPTPTTTDELQSASTDTEGEDEVAPPPPEVKSGNRVTHRQYVILQQTGASEPTFKQLSWHEKDGKMVPKKGPGTKRQSICLARTNEDALRFAFAALGQPTGGVRLVAVASLHWTPQNVRPKPPEPEKTRVIIG